MDGKISAQSVRRALESGGVGDLLVDSSTIHFPLFRDSTTHPRLYDKLLASIDRLEAMVGDRGHWGTSPHYVLACHQGASRLISK